jgi:hypothetical protein
MITIACVLKTGGEYNRSHVEALQAMVPGYPFVCLSDDPSVPGYVPLRHNWPGWWSKLELFTLPGPVLFFDLDTIVLKDVEDLVPVILENDFLILRDVYRGKNNPLAMQSSVMAWRGDMSYVYEKFAKDAAAWMRETQNDQEFCEQAIDRATYWQDVVPGSLASFKVDVQGKGVPEASKIIFFHGRPRPWQQSEVSYGGR